MSPAIVLALLLALGGAAWFAARGRAQAMYTGRGSLRAMPNYHGWHMALWVLVPALLGWGVWNAIAPGLIHGAIMAHPAAQGLPAMDMERDAIVNEAIAAAKSGGFGAFRPESAALTGPVKEILARFDWIGAGLSLVLALAGGAFGYTRVTRDFPARTRVERAVLGLLLAASSVAIITTLGIIGSLVFEAFRFFTFVSPFDFLFGTNWNPDPFAPINPEIGKKLGAVPLFWGTLFIGAIIAMIVAVPLGLMSAIYLTQYASARFRKWVKPMLEILAGVPTVVYGYFAALTVAPLVRDFAAGIGVANPTTESALAAGLVMGVMIIPFVSSMADDSIAAVPQAMRDGSLAMGATKSETIRKVLIPAALPGIVAGVMLAISRAIGETMIVYMAAGAAARLSANPFDSMTTVTYQIARLLTGDGDFAHPSTLSAFALGLVLFGVTLVLNIVALRVVKRFREAYE
ncbi:MULTISPECIES: phosphate ABC transporter permease subunit PstC [unclassified Novosphingobium]|uniref:phosphate ABC transporter permease subunit PstC n=1 Tax=unclassified Novosphingobium TaxID=2644732 RepID=UPI0025F1D95B|nr:MULTISPECIES: phosphate ABC transporter permease subunit PstC [unclassified Novosphingobium]HQV01916.1 phosphate ABC transporter permease subunit PstC [Novosphingobium sp.]